MPCWRVRRIDFPAHFACAMDVHPRNNLLLLCGVAKEQSQVGRMHQGSRT